MFLLAADLQPVPSAGLFWLNSDLFAVECVWVGTQQAGVSMYPPALRASLAGPVSRQAPSLSRFAGRSVYSYNLTIS